MVEHLTDQLAAALREAVRALNVHPRFRVQETNSYAIVSKCDAALKRYNAANGTGRIDPDQMALVLESRAAAIFSINKQQ